MTTTDPLTIVADAIARSDYMTTADVLIGNIVNDLITAGFLDAHATGSFYPAERAITNAVGDTVRDELAVRVTLSEATAQTVVEMSIASLRSARLLRRAA